MKKPAIPQIPKEGQPRHGFDGAVKENIEVITGRRGEAIQPLRVNADLANVIAKVNEIIARLQS